MNIENIMSTDIISVSMDHTLKKIQDLFESANFHHLLVIEDNSLIGVISDRDVLKSISPYAGTASELPRDAGTSNNDQETHHGPNEPSLPQQHAHDEQDANYYGLRVE